jgi:hypothetical protein
MIQDPHPSDRVVYEVDGNDTLCAVNPAWTEFATANGATGLLPKHVLGTCLWSHVVGEETSTLYRSLLDVVRRTQRTVSFQYRCDSPDLRRFMRMTVSPVRHAGVVFESVLIRSEQRDRAVHMRYAGIAVHPMVLRCSMCNRLQFRGEWMDIAEAFKRGEVLNTEIPIRVAYTVCEPCGESISSRCFTSTW